jgi:CO/xanthine dehydrogenase FAD-binding subunit
MTFDPVIQPRSETGLVAALSDGVHRRVVAGGTDLVIRCHKEQSRDSGLIDLSHASFLRGIRVTDEGVWIGACTTMTDLEHSPIARQRVEVLSRAAASVGSAQIRNLATIGGNVASAAQCADTIPALIALDAEAELLSSGGRTRKVRVADLVTGIGRTLLAENEVITGFHIPEEWTGRPGGFGKVGARKAVTIAKINGAGVFRLEGGIIREARLAFGSIGERAFLAEPASRTLIGRNVIDHSAIDHSAIGHSVIGRSLAQLDDESLFEPFQRMVEEAIPARASLSYKRSAVRAVVDGILQTIRTTGEGAQHG